MQPTYFASFLLGVQANASPVAIDGPLEEIARWIFENPHRRLVLRPAGWPEAISGPITFPDGERVQLLRLEIEGCLQAAAVRFEHSDREGRFWRTDTILTKVLVPEPAVRFAVNVAAGSSGDSLFPVTPPCTRPRIVPSMIDRFGGRERYPLVATYLGIRAEEAERFAGFLLDNERTIPIVFVSRRNRDGEFLCDLRELTDKLVGIAYVCVADDIQLSWNLLDYIDNQLNAYDGTVRVYWPRMTRDDPPYRHRWWTQQKLFALQATGRSFADELLGLIASASVTRRIAGLVRWEDIEREITKQTWQNVSDEWLGQYNRDLEELDETRVKLADASDRLREKEEEVRQWKQMYLQLLRGGAVGSEDTYGSDVLIEDTESAIDAAAQDFESKLVIIEGRIDKSAREFEEAELLYAAFKWLATTYWDTKAGMARCPDLDKSCREACQFWYRAHQSDITMGMFASDYEINYDGQRTKLKEHIGFGTSTEPRHTIRVAFFFDETKQKVVVGYMGQHQATRKSN